MSFNTICQKLVDAWVSCSDEQQTLPVGIYGSITSQLTPRMRLSVIEIDGDDPRQWVLSTLRHSRIAARILNLDAIFVGGKLGSISDQSYLEQSVYPAYLTVVQRRQPMIDVVETKLLGVRVIYDRVILPQKSASRPKWLIVCTFGRFMAKTPEPALEMDSTDEAILSAMIEGMTSKEIAIQIGLSPRTVEHRIDRVKKQAGARSLPHLAALLVSAGFDRTMRLMSSDSGR